jgi:hypothetical protein
MDLPDKIVEALKELDIKIEKDEYKKLEKEYIKKQYYKMALKWHPDKNKDKDATLKFQKIGKAYEFLINEFEFSESKEDNEDVSEMNWQDYFKMEKPLYINILDKFISSLINGNYDYKLLIINIIKEIVTNYQSITIESLEFILKDIDKQVALDLYKLINKYKNILYIKNEIIEIIYEVIKRKYEKDQVYILRPTLRDLIQHNIYKLYIEDELYLVPLWHNELYFDLLDKDKKAELIVFCQPILSEGIVIDEENNIIVEKKFKKMDYWDLIEKEILSIEIEGLELNIKIADLYMKKEQYYVIKEKGIAKIDENYIYNTEQKSDIIVHISFY